MIQANELRIGNWIYAFPTNEPTQVVSVLCDMVESMKSRNTLDDIDPIPLTEEWLLRFGFVQNDPIASREYNLLKKSANWLAVNHYGDGWVVKCDFWKVGVMIKNVHTLQNLYFALTGAELKQKEG